MAHPASNASEIAVPAIQKSTNTQCNCCRSRPRRKTTRHAASLLSTSLLSSASALFGTAIASPISAKGKIRISQSILGSSSGSFLETTPLEDKEARPLQRGRETWKPTDPLCTNSDKQSQGSDAAEILHAEKKNWTSSRARSKRNIDRVRLPTSDLSDKDVDAAVLNQKYQASTVNLNVAHEDVYCGNIAAYAVQSETEKSLVQEDLKADVGPITPFVKKSDISAQVAAPISSRSSAVPSSNSTTHPNTISLDPVLSFSSAQGFDPKDHSRPAIPSGWVTKGRTAAYAVPVIIGISVFLAVAIFGLIILLVRKARKRKQRKRCSSNTREEGKVEQDPTNEEGHALVSATSRVARMGNDSVLREKKKKFKISRVWGPSSNSQGMRRRNRKTVSPVLMQSSGPEETVIGLGASTKRLDDAIAEEERVDGPASAVQVNAVSERRTVSSASSVGHSASNGPDRRSRPPSISLSQLPDHSTSSPNLQEDNAPASLSSLGPPAYGHHPPTPAYSSSLLPGMARSSIDSRHAFPMLTNATNEKRANYASGTETPIVSDISSDPYRGHRRFEHLYESREDVQSEREQRSGAPHIHEDSHSGGIRMGPLMPLQAYPDGEQLDDSRLHGHIAVDDKELLGRIRLAGSSPMQDQHYVEAGMPLPFRAASAPLLNDTFDDEQYESTSGMQQTLQISTDDVLPLPPRPISFTFQPPLESVRSFDDKTRLRQMEDVEIFQSGEPPACNSSAPTTETYPSAPPFTAVFEASTQSLAEEANSIKASAPPLEHDHDSGEDREAR